MNPRTVATFAFEVKHSNHSARSHLPYVTFSLVLVRIKLQVNAYSMWLLFTTYRFESSIGNGNDSYGAISERSLKSQKFNI